MKQLTCPHCGREFTDPHATRMRERRQALTPQERSDQGKRAAEARWSRQKSPALPMQANPLLP